MSYQPTPLFSWTMSLQILLKSEHFSMSMLFTFFKFYNVVSCCLYLYHEQMKVWGNSNFKASYLHLDFMKMVIVLDRSQKTIKDYWCSSDILKGSIIINTACGEASVKCLNVVWWNISHNLCTNSQYVSQWRILLMTLAGQHNRPHWIRLEPKI